MLCSIVFADEAHVSGVDGRIEPGGVVAGIVIDPAAVRAPKQDEVLRRAVGVGDRGLAVGPVVPALGLGVDPLEHAVYAEQAYPDEFQPLYVRQDRDPVEVGTAAYDRPFDIKSATVFAFYKPLDDEDVIEVKRDTVDLTPVVFQEIMMDVTMRVVKDGATLKTEGNGWKVLNEKDEGKDEDYIDSRLAKLKDYFKDKE